MEDKKRESSALPISGILVLLVVFGGVWLYEKPLKGTRPAISTNVSYEERVPARLWQDPFAAVAKYKNDMEIVGRSMSSSDFARKITDKIKDYSSVTVLGIMVFGSPYAEAAEDRLRRRYAAVSALGRLKYIPDYSQHIDFFESEMAEGVISGVANGNELCDCTDQGQGHKLIVPFEWFSEEKKNADSSHAVLVLWLNEDKFQSNPLLKLSNLISGIKNSVNKNDASNACRLEFKILGPAGSTNLVSMMKEVSKLDCKCSKCELVDCKCGECEFAIYEDFQIYSPFATADKTSLFEHGLGSKSEECKYGNVSKYLVAKSCGKIKLIRTIGSDKDLCESLNRELILRRASPIDNNENHIALIAEWDTFYGRSLPQSFNDSVVSFGLPSEFHINEFKGQHEIDKLCKKIEDGYDFEIDSKIRRNTIKWLNKLLEEKGLYEKRSIVTKNTKHLSEINRLDKVINKLDVIINENQDSKPHESIAKKSEEKKRKKEMKETNEMKERCIKRRNRLLLENIYPGETPPIGTQIHRFSYLRGIDGQLPGETLSGLDHKKAEKQSKSNKDSKETNSMRRPTGRNQFDYLIRLTQQIKQINNELRIHDEGKIAAIGVLGSDVYDKLLILQAMRQYFPEVVFFTTDLDARLLHPDEFKWTRNLIVASYFGLRLHKDIHDPIPPFRDNYQTSLFFSIILALKASNQIFNDSIPQQNTINQLLQPQIFEIGRRGEFDLTEYKHKHKDTVISINMDNLEMSKKLIPTTLYPKSDLSKGDDYVGFFKHISLFVIGGIFALFALLYVSSDTTKKSVAFICNSNNKFDYIMRLLTLSLIVIVLITLFYILHMWGSKFYLEEPFSLFDGVSIWPTEILRFISAILSILFLFIVWYKIKFTDRFITDNFGLPELEKKSIKISKLAYVFPYYWNIDDKNEKEGAACFGKIWKEYLSLGSFGISTVRTVIYTVAFIVFVILFITVLKHFDCGLFTPARGDTSFIFDKVILLFSVSCMLFLTFFIVGRHELLRRFIELSSKHEKICLPKVGIYSREHAYQKILIMAEYTEHIKYLNVYSFIVLSLMIIARNGYFDNWNMNIGLLFIFVTLGIYSFACTILLHMAVKKCKDDTVARLKKEIVFLNRNILKENKVGNSDYEKANFEIEHIQFIINTIESIRKGAFRPLHKQPLVQAALLPFGGASSLLFINFLT